MNPSVSTLFSIHIIEGQVDADFDKLEKLLLDNYSKRWSDDPTHTRYEDSCCPSSPLVDDIFDQVLDDLYKVTEEEVFVSDYWGHIHEKNMSTSPHCHRGSLAAGVIYIAAPEGAGSIVFRSNFDIANKNAFIKSFPPVRGHYYVFPGYLEHYVNRNNSEEMRISLSFNLDKKGVKR